MNSITRTQNNWQRGNIVPVVDCGRVYPMGATHCDYIRQNNSTGIVDF